MHPFIPKNINPIVFLSNHHLCILYVDRLFAVLLMPSSTTVEQQHKIRDMKALGRWYANAISPNEGLAGTLKPDYLGFHHNSFYASAYTPHALHKAALIEYLLSGTPFAFSEYHYDIRRNNFHLTLEKSIHLWVCCSLYWKLGKQWPLSKTDTWGWSLQCQSLFLTKNIFETLKASLKCTTDTLKPILEKR